MGFLDQNKQNQRSLECFIIIIYSLYTINLCTGMIRNGKAAWIPGVMIALAAAGWGVFLGNYKTFRIRAALTTVLMQITVILRAANTEDLSKVIPIFMVLTVVVALYGQIRLLWITLASVLFIIFYHGVVRDTFVAQPGEALIFMVSQMGNVICLYWSVY